MLGKLMKYEFKATSRIFLPFFGALLVMSGITRLFWSLFQTDELDEMITQLVMIPKILSVTLYIMVIIAIVIVTYIVMIQRFYKNLLGDQGYLMFTLPVEPWMNIVNKLLVSLIWILASMVVMMLSGLILAAGTELWNEMVAELPRAFREIVDLFEQEFHMSIVWLVVEWVAAVIISTIHGILQIYAAIAIGHLCGRYKILASVGAYLGISIVVQTIGGIFSVVVMIPFINAANSPQMLSSYWNLSMLSGIAISLLTAAGCYIATHIILTRKLNLE